MKTSAICTWVSFSTEIRRIISTMKMHIILLGCINGPCRVRGFYGSTHTPIHKTHSTMHIVSQTDFSLLSTRCIQMNESSEGKNRVHCSVSIFISQSWQSRSTKTLLSLMSSRICRTVDGRKNRRWTVSRLFYFYHRQCIQCSNSRLRLFCLCFPMCFCFLHVSWCITFLFLSEKRLHVHIDCV